MMAQSQISHCSECHHTKLQIRQQIKAYKIIAGLTAGLSPEVLIKNLEKIVGEADDKDITEFQDIDKNLNPPQKSPPTLNVIPNLNSSRPRRTKRRNQSKILDFQNDLNGSDKIKKSRGRGGPRKVPLIVKMFEKTAKSVFSSSPSQVSQDALALVDSLIGPVLPPEPGLEESHMTQIPTNENENVSKEKGMEAKVVHSSGDNGSDKIEIMNEDHVTDTEKSEPVKESRGDEAMIEKINRNIRKVFESDGESAEKIIFECILCDKSCHLQTQIARHIRVVHFKNEMRQQNVTNEIQNVERQIQKFKPLQLLEPSNELVSNINDWDDIIELL